MNTPIFGEKIRLVLSGDRVLDTMAEGILETAPQVNLIRMTKKEAGLRPDVRLPAAITENGARYYGLLGIRMLLVHYLLPDSRYDVRVG